MFRQKLRLKDNLGGLEEIRHLMSWFYQVWSLIPRQKSMEKKAKSLESMYLVDGLTDEAVESSRR